MTKKVLSYIKEHNMIEEGDLVVAGVSGGADSVCLLFVLIEIRRIIPIEISVVHVNHMIRSDASADAEYVRRLCLDNGISFTLVEKDVEKIASKLNISTEEAGRNLRYEAFYRVLGDNKGKIAVAHNKNDCCETFLFNLFRGSSLKGLVGIRPSRDKIIRPLMCLERGEIEEYLNSRGIHYCTDSTNLGDDYTRNRIRHHILGRAVSDICPASVNNIGNACERVSEAYDLIEELVAQGVSKCVETVIDDKTYHIDEKNFNALHKTIQGYVIMEVLNMAAKSGRDLEAVHVRDVRLLMGKQCGREVTLPYNLIARRDYTGITIFSQNDKNSDIANNNEGSYVMSESQRKDLDDGLEVVVGPFKFIKKIEKISNLQNIPQKKYTKWFDYDKIKGNIAVRTRKQGDYITVNALNQKKTLKAYFVNEKVPSMERDSIWLVAEDSHVLWVLGMRISSYYKVTGDTKSILCVEYMCKEE
jgi:tRNA(Ile)-lysidine synthase